MPATDEGRGRTQDGQRRWVVGTQHPVARGVDARGLGLGRKLLARAMQEAQDWDAAFLTLMVDRSNDIAQAFYAKLGFTGRGDYDLLILEGEGLNSLLAQ